MAPGNIWEKEGEEKDSSWLAAPIWRIMPMKDSLDFLVFDDSVSRLERKINFKHENIRMAKAVSGNRCLLQKHSEAKQYSSEN